MFEHVDDNKMNYVCNKIVENKAVLLSNTRIWTAFLDEKLRDFVVEYNFNFFEVANRFHEFIAFPYKYDFSEDEIRRHWSFLHACRYLGKEIDDEYYDKIKASAKEEEKELNNKKEEDVLDLEKEKREMEKFKAERFNLIDMGNGNSKEKESRDGKDKIDYDNPVEQNLRNDEHFEKCIEKINLQRNENGEEVEVDTTIQNNDQKSLHVIQKTINQEIKSDNNKKETENLVERSINEINKTTVIKENSNHNIEKLSGFDDDDVINALFKVTQKIYTEEDLPKNLTIDGKDFKLPELDKEKEDDLFPININNLPQHNLTEEEMLDYREKMLSGMNNEGIYPNIDKTKSFDDLIKEDDNLKTQYDNLNTYFKFAVKSLNYFIPKISKKLKGNENPEKDETLKEGDSKDTKEDKVDGTNDHQIKDSEEKRAQDEYDINERYNLNDKEKQEYKSMFGFEENYIRKASEKINDLIMSRVKDFDEKNEEHILQVNRLIDEEEKKMLNNFEAEKEKKDKDYTEPIDEDQERKKEKFKTYLFSQAQNITTPELLSQIVNIIQGSYMDEIKIRNDIANEENSEEQEKDELKDLDNLKRQIKKNDIALLNDKTKNSKEPEFIIDENGVKKYKHYYRGMVQYLEKPPGNKKTKNNEDSDDSYISD